MHATREKETTMHHRKHSPQSHGTDQNQTPRRLLPLLLVAQLMVILDITAVNIAMPNLARDLHISGASIGWTITAYSLVFGSLLLLGGRAADLIGRRRMFLTGLGIFTASSLASAMAGSAATLFAAAPARASAPRCSLRPRSRSSPAPFTAQRAPRRWPPGVRSVVPVPPSAFSSAASSPSSSTGG
jgi:hypothetical protein